MSFDEEELDPHGECAAEIKRLQAENERLRDENGLLLAAVHFAHEQGFVWPAADPLAFLEKRRCRESG